MEKHRAIPKGYMTVGELAKKMGVTVRTLQHYDREGFFSPSAESEGGRRLYTDKDLVRLHQILSLKQLGFSLEDIKNKVIPLGTPTEVAKILTEQAADIKRKIQSLTKAGEQIELFKAEVLKMQSVDFNKYADIIVNLQMKNENYFLIKHFDDQTLDHIRGRFDMESGVAFMNQFNSLNDKILKLKEDHVSPDSEAAQVLAKAFWEMVMVFTAGDMSVLHGLIDLGSKVKDNPEQGRNLTLANGYIEKALDIYFIKLGVDPLGEESK